MPVVPDARPRAPPQRRPWSWTDALPAVAPGRRYLVSWLLVAHLEREIAWFVQVMPAERPR